MKGNPDNRKKSRIGLITLTVLGVLLVSILAGSALFISAEEPLLGDEDPVLGADYEKGKRFDTVDTNDDGLIGETEWDAFMNTRQARVENRLTERFCEIDTDDDGSVTSEELETCLAERDERIAGNVQERFDLMDTDDDGTVSEEEFAAHIEAKFSERRQTMEEKFSEIDKN